MQNPAQLRFHRDDVIGAKSSSSAHLDLWGKAAAAAAASLSLADPHQPPMLDAPGKTADEFMGDSDQTVVVVRWKNLHQ